MPRRFHTLTILAIAISFGASAAQAKTLKKEGKTASGQTCTVVVEKHPDGSITTFGSAGGSAATGSVSSSTSAGGSSVHVQAGGGSVSSSTSVGGVGSASTSTMTVDGCTITTSASDKE